MKFITTLMFAFAIAIGTSCSTASATAINLGQDFEYSLIDNQESAVISVDGFDGGVSICYKSFATHVKELVLDIVAQKYFVPLTIGKVNTKSKSVIRVFARDSLNS